MSENNHSKTSQPKVILVNAGPHKSGCTDRALHEVASALEENGVDADIFWVGTKPLASCIGCRKCEKNCPAGAVTVTDNVAHIDGSLCTGCGTCMEECPRGCIVR